MITVFFIHEQVIFNEMLKVIQLHSDSQRFKNSQSQQSTPFHKCCYGNPKIFRNVNGHGISGFSKELLVTLKHSL